MLYLVPRPHVGLGTRFVLAAVIGASLSEPHTCESNGAIFIYYWGERSEPHTCGENGKLSIYIYIYIYIYLFIYIYGTCVFRIRESVDSLCRDGADAQYMQYLSKSRITSPQTRKKLI